MAASVPVMPVRVAVLDDHQGIALRSGPWSSLGAGVRVEAFTDHVAGDAALAERLAPFEVVVAMRERTPFTAARARGSCRPCGCS